MNITFLIGNGFDLNLGLNTKYIDFKDYYFENAEDCKLKKLLSDYKKTNLWSDLEIGIGKLLEKFDENEIDDFLNSKERLESLLTNYLKIESKRFVITDEKQFSTEFRDKVVNFFTRFNLNERNAFGSFLSSANSIQYSFVTFNYTDVIDTMIKIVQKHFSPFSAHASRNTQYTDAVFSPLHIHGTLQEGLILGLDNINQIKNEKLRSNKQLTDYIIKTTINKELGERKTERAKEIIDNSRYICLFGLSIGDTDSVWWKYLIEWLKRDASNRLALFVCDKSEVQASALTALRRRDSQRGIMMKQGQCADAEWEKIKDRVIIVPNSPIFNFKHIKILKKEEIENDKTQNAHPEQG